uniref:Uncharacterized protein n=1 Tax=Meloidogyne enterolobii TaxID=390850 RepID=A0A6V7WZG4_MELEN|nr:unnamed protein product [Meloidogyne enterolobii]
MKPNFKRYLYMFSSVLLVGVFYNLLFIFFATFDGGIKMLDEVNRTLPFIIMKSTQDLPSIIMILIIILPFIIIFICGFKMVYYVNSHTGFDQNMKRLLKQLTKTLIILAIIPFINQFLALLVILFKFNNEPSNNENSKNIICIFLVMFTHFTPVFNPIFCIITNKPYREAVFNRLKIHPQ